MQGGSQLQFQLITPDKIIFSGLVSMVVIPAARGNLGVLPEHAPMMANLQSGLIEVFQGQDAVEKIFIAGGFAEITPQACNVVAENALFVKDIDTQELEAYIETTLAELEAVPDIDEKELLRQNLDIARMKIEIFRRLNRAE